MAVVNSNRFNFREFVEEALTNYVQDGVVPALEESLDEVSKEAVKRLKANTKAKLGGTGKYAKSWAREREKGRLKVGYTVYNKLPGLPHLLEYSHALRNGGRSRPIEHIAPVAQWAAEEAIDRFYDKLEGI